MAASEKTCWWDDERVLTFVGRGGGRGATKFLPRLQRKQLRRRYEALTRRQDSCGCGTGTTSRTVRLLEVFDGEMTGRGERLGGGLFGRLA